MRDIGATNALFAKGDGKGLIRRIPAPKGATGARASRTTPRRIRSARQAVARRRRAATVRVGALANGIRLAGEDHDADRRRQGGGTQGQAQNGDREVETQERYFT